jgi:hypothetical protein
VRLTGSSAAGIGTIRHSCIPTILTRLDANLVRSSSEPGSIVAVRPAPGNFGRHEVDCPLFRSRDVGRLHPLVHGNNFAQLASVEDGRDR